ncbi:MAG: carbohydrate ABC transporter permease, partial [Pseudomonadota bacterium]
MASVVHDGERTGIIGFLTRTRGRHRLHWTDWFSYGYLLLGVLLMFGPVVWVVLSSFKTQAQILEFPPSLLPYGQTTAQVEGYDQPLPLFRLDDGTVLAQVRRIGIESQLVDPDNPGEIVKVNVKEREPVRAFSLAWSNYAELFQRFSFGRYLWNSVFITAVATVIMLVFNSMAAFALAKYD